MSKPSPTELKTIGLTPALHCADQALFHVARDVPLGDALSMASDFLHLAKLLSEDAAYARDSDRHAWAAHYLGEMAKAVVDDLANGMLANGVTEEGEVAGS